MIRALLLQQAINLAFHQHIWPNITAWDEGADPAVDANADYSHCAFCYSTLSSHNHHMFYGREEGGDRRIQED